MERATFNALRLGYYLIPELTIDFAKLRNVKGPSSVYLAIEATNWVKMGCKQVDNFTVKLPDYTVVAIKRVYMSSYKHEVYLDWYKTYNKLTNFEGHLEIPKNAQFHFNGYLLYEDDLISWKKDSKRFLQENSFQ